MCGIAGWMWNERQPNPGDVEQTLRRMAGRMTHRGPDEEGIHIGPHAGLAHRRLSIIDLSTGRQPQGNEDGQIQVVFNGEIYNFQSIRDGLLTRGHTFVTQSDTEVLVHLWEELGPNMLEHLRGMFAFAIYDRRDGTLFVARDRLGVKPLLYAETPSGFFFASEMQAILSEPSVRPVLDLESLDLYLSLQYVPSPRSIYTTVKKLPPAHYMIVRGGRVDCIRRYWSLDPHARPMSRGEAMERLRAEMAEAVRIRMISDVPLGAFLSGGIDSTITVGLMARCSSIPIRTFCIGFEESDYSELAHAREAAAFHGTEHREHVVRPDAIQLLPTLVRHYGEPYADSSAIPTYYLCEMTRRYVTVALSGDAGDESFLGYNRYLAMRLVPVLNKLPATLRRTISAVLSRFRRPAARQAMRLLQLCDRTPIRSYLEAVSHFTPADKERLYQPGMIQRFRAEDDTTAAERYFRGFYPEDAPLLQSLSYLDLHTYLPEDILAKVDIASMANSLETRSAFLDQKVVELAMSMPPEIKMPGLRKKDLLKAAFKDLLPPGIQSRGKQGFGVPLEHWFRRDLKDFAKEMLDRPPEALRDVFRGEAARGFLQDHIDHRRKNDQRLWNLLFLYTWARTFPIADVR